MKKKITREDERYIYVADMSEKEMKEKGVQYRCYLNDWDMGGWTGDYQREFEEAILSELAYAIGLGGKLTKEVREAFDQCKFVEMNYSNFEEDYEEEIEGLDLEDQFEKLMEQGE